MSPYATNSQTSTVVRVSSVVFPLLLFAYSKLLGLDAMQRIPGAGEWSFYAAASTWLALGLYTCFRPSQTNRQRAWQLVLYHGLAASYLLSISGVAVPFTCAWSLFMLAAFAYAGFSGWLLSALVLFITAALDAFWLTPQSIVDITTTTLMAFMLGVVIVALAYRHNLYRSALHTSREAMTLQHDRLLTIINNLATAIIATDQQGIIQLYNAATLDLLDTNTSPHSKPIDTILPLRDSAKQPVCLSQLLHAAIVTQTRDDVWMEVSGEMLRLSIVFSPIRAVNTASDSSDGYVLILRDITKEKSLEEERDEFISVVSHELRTPLTAAEGALSNIQLMLHRRDMPQHTLKDHLDAAHEQVVFLAKMVNDLSTLAQAERGAADMPELLNVRALMDDLYHQYHPQATKKQLALTLETSPRLGYVVASSLYVRELIQNFLSNALKYTKEGEIHLSARKKGNRIIIAVRDTGIGISKSDQAHILERFWRSEDYRTRETGGTGLGLYIAAKLARKLGTRIEFTSQLNHGSTFFFALPAAAQQAALREKHKKS